MATRNPPFTSELPADRTGRVRSASPGLARIAWRNLWRNRRRTWLTAGGVAFAIFLIVFARSAQDGTFSMMVDNGARLWLGHVQLQHPDYEDDPKLEHTVDHVSEVVAKAAAQPGVKGVSARAQEFALVSHGERTFGAQVVGVEPEREAAWSTLSQSVAEGRFLTGPGEGFIGAVLARNLGIQTGDEMVVLGTSLEGGVAAAVVEVVGTFDTGQVELDRSMALITLEDFQSAWGLGDEAHVVAVLAEGMRESEAVADRLQGDGYRVLRWTDLMPEAEQTIELKRVTTQMFFAIVGVIVTFSVINTFMMVIFERTAELGMLKALGMRPRDMVAMLWLEAVWLGVLGIAVGLLVSFVLTAILGRLGIPLPVDLAQEIFAKFHMPERMYPSFNWTSAWTASLVMLVATQVAAVVPAIRLQRLKPVDALRGGE